MATLLDVLRRTQVVRTIDAILEAQYEAEERAIHSRQADENLRSGTWHHSFHASSFPLDPATSCGRKAVYGLMGLPASEPTSRYGRAIMESGEHIEEMVLRRLKGAGVLLSQNDGNGKQTSFTHRAYWLTGFVDAIINLDGRVHVVEIKSKKHEHVEQMRNMERSFDVAHRGQCMTYMWFTRMAHEHLGFDKLGLKPCQSGTIIYLSRDAPGYSAEFWIDFDEDEFNAGLARLKKWKESYLEKELPPRDPSLYWTKPPCQYCDFKKVCKEDDKLGVISLDTSGAIGAAREIIPDYDFDKVWQEVMGSWAPPST